MNHIHTHVYESVETHTYIIYTRTYIYRSIYKHAYQLDHNVNRIKQNENLGRAGVEI